MMNLPSTRRGFLGTCAASVVALLVPGRRALAATPPKHPTPRPGITGENVLKGAPLAEYPGLVALFDGIRAIPEIVDGIHCNCGCTNPPVYYSLLSCYEGKGMARECAVCQGQGRLAVRLHSEGKTLDEIRTAIDARFG
jgi:hypothetical protein